MEKAKVEICNLCHPNIKMSCWQYCHCLCGGLPGCAEVPGAETGPSVEGKQLQGS